MHRQECLRCLVNASRLAGRGHEARRLAGSSAPQASVRRSMLYVPGSDPRKLKKSHDSPADAICYDLEDSVAIAQKSGARKNVLDALNYAKRGHRELLVRVNSRTTGLTEDDLGVVLATDNIDGIVIPKVHTADDVHWVLDRIRHAVSTELRNRLRIVASIESAQAIMNLREIAQASPQVDTLLFAAEDFCADSGIARTPSRVELLYARSAVVIAARAFKLASMDMVCVNLDDPDVLANECAEGRRLGFTCKQAIHPKQVETINASFSPSAASISRAVAIIEQNAANTKAGRGAFGFDDAGGSRTMIDAPMILQANAVIDQATSLGLDVPWTDGRPPRV